MKKTFITSHPVDRSAFCIRPWLKPAAGLAQTAKNAEPMKLAAPYEFRAMCLKRHADGFAA
jgi:hypothetical protein